MKLCVPELHPVPVVTTWHHLGIDFIGPLRHRSRQGNRYILTLSDYFSKFTQAFPCQNKEASTVQDALLKVHVKIEMPMYRIIYIILFQLFMQFGLPRVITTDQGSEFNNNLDKKLMDLLNIDHRLTTPYHPQVTR